MAEILCKTGSFLESSYLTPRSLNKFLKTVHTKTCMQMFVSFIYCYQKLEITQMFNW
jgi:uncharacterized membrane protein